MAQNASRISDGELDVRLRLYAGSRKGVLAFFEDTANSLVVQPALPLVFEIVEHVDHSAVQLPDQTVTPLRTPPWSVLGKRNPLRHQIPPEGLVCLLESGGCPRIGQVEASTQVEVGPDSPEPIQGRAETRVPRSRSRHQASRSRWRWVEAALFRVAQPPRSHARSRGIQPLGGGDMQRSRVLLRQSQVRIVLG